MESQGEIMAAQQTTLKEQHALAEQQMRWRRDEAIGTFFRLAHDLVGEFRKANVLPLTTVPADFNTHPRQVLREARLNVKALLGSKKRSHQVPAISRRRFRAEAQDVSDRSQQVSGGERFP